MKIICDTNIWRKLAKHEINEKYLNEVSSPLTATFINIDEITKSHLYINDKKHCQDVIKLIMRMPAKIIYDPPLIHLKKLDDPKYEYNFELELNDMLYLTRKIVQDEKINTQILQQYIKLRADHIVDFCDLVNENSETIRNNLKNTFQHRKHNTIAQNRTLISLLVKLTTGEFLSDNFEWGKIELFENVLKEYFIDLEVSKMKFKPHDVYDLFQLLYIQPTDKIWTTDLKRGPLKYIEKLNLQKYLFGI